MKTLKILIAILLINGLAFSAILRVNGNEAAGAPYTVIQTAVNVANAGDTLLIEGYTNYAGWIADKKLTYIGPGYFLSENPETQANTSPAIISGYVTLGAGSAESIITGLQFHSGVYLKDDELIIKRNYFSAFITIGDDGNGDNIIFKQNYYYVNSSSYYLTINTGCDNIMIYNNFLYNNYTTYKIIQMGTNSSARFDHNIIQGELTVYNSTLSNNIFNYLDNSNINDSQFFSNIFGLNSWVDNIPTGNDNVFNVDMETVFVGADDNSTDGQWKLKAGSPAIGADAEGDDCGMFGGSSSYVLSGLPHELPAIYYLYSSGQGSPISGINIHLKAKTRDE